MSDPVKPPRPYRSTRRREQAQQTRVRILEASGRLFVQRGFAGTTVAAIAAEAGVAAETVYATFGSKPKLLAELVRSAARGAAPEPILGQSGPAEVAASTDQREQIRLFASDVARRLERVGPLMAVMAEAARGEPALAELMRELHEARLRNLRVLVQTLSQNGRLRPDPERAAETVWALASPELYALLTGVAGWPHARYEEWLADGLTAILLEAQA